MNALTFENFQTFSKTQVEAATSFAATVSKGLQDIAAEATDYSKHSMTTGAETVEKLLGAKTVETAVQIQTEYAKAAYEGFVARTTKINELFAKLAAESMKPAQSLFAMATVKP